MISLQLKAKIEVEPQVSFPIIIVGESEEQINNLGLEGKVLMGNMLSISLTGSEILNLENNNQHLTIEDDQEMNAL